MLEIKKPMLIIAHIKLLFILDTKIAIIAAHRDNTIAIKSNIKAVAQFVKTYHKRLLLVENSYCSMILRQVHNLHHAC